MKRTLFLGLIAACCCAGCSSANWHAADISSQLWALESTTLQENRDFGPATQQETTDSTDDVLAAALLALESAEVTLYGSENTPKTRELDAQNSEKIELSKTTEPDTIAQTKTDNKIQDLPKNEKDIKEHQKQLEDYSDILASAQLKQEKDAILPALKEANQATSQSTPKEIVASPNMDKKNELKVAETEKIEQKSEQQTSNSLKIQSSEPTQLPPSESFPQTQPKLAQSAKTPSTQPLDTPTQSPASKTVSVKNKAHKPDMIAADSSQKNDASLANNLRQDKMDNQNLKNSKNDRSNSKPSLEPSLLIAQENPALAYVWATYTVNKVDLSKIKGSSELPTIYDLYRFAYNQQLVYQAVRPAVGDLVFFHNTYDRNQDALWNDWHTLVGIVETIDNDDNIQVLVYQSNKIQRIAMNLKYPELHKSKKGTILNSQIRSNANGQIGLASKLFAGFANLLGDAKSVVVIDNWQPGMKIQIN